MKHIYANPKGFWGLPVEEKISLSEAARKMYPDLRTSLCCDSGAIAGIDIHRSPTMEVSYMGMCADCKEHAQFVTDEEGEDIYGR